MTQDGEQEATPPWDAARVNLTSNELAPGVFAVMPDDVFEKDHVATTAGFVIGERSVLVVEVNAEWRSRRAAYRARTSSDVEADPLPRQHQLSR